MTPDSITRTGAQAWIFDTTSGTAPFNYYLYGRIVLITNEIQVTFEDAAYVNEPPDMIVFDANDTGDPESVTYPPYARLQFRGRAEAVHYRIEKFIASVWTTQTPTIFEDGSGYYHWESTDALDDLTTHQFRIIAVDEDGNESGTVAFDVFTVRNPAHPAVTVTWDQGNSEFDMAAT